MSPKKTMEEVSAGFGVAFPGKYESGDFEEDYEDMEDDPFVSPLLFPLLFPPLLSPSSLPSSPPPPLPLLDIQLLDKDTELSNENNVQCN